MTDAATTDPEVTTVMDVVDTLEELVGGGRRLPFTTNVVVNEEDILELVDRIRVSLPEDLLAARHTMEERDLLLERARHDADELNARAREEGERVVREAHAQAAALVEENAITSAAEEQARSTAAEALAEATAQRRAADDYAREAMTRLEEQLERVLGTVRAGLQTLPDGDAPTRRRKR